jgi:hypothetical protein
MCVGEIMNGEVHVFADNSVCPRVLGWVFNEISRTSTNMHTLDALEETKLALNNTSKLRLTTEA